MFAELGGTEDQADESYRADVAYLHAQPDSGLLSPRAVYYHAQFEADSPQGCSLSLESQDLMR